MAKTNLTNTGEVKAGAKLVREMLDAAKTSAVTHIELEWDSGGWVITFFCGAVGIGGSPFGREEMNAVLNFIRTNTRFRRGRGRLKTEELDWQGKVRVEQYESFGEWNYRLHL